MSDKPGWSHATRRVLAACAGIAALAAAAAQEVAWPATGRDLHGTRYLPATEIDRDNVARLAVAWTYRTGETEPRFATAREASFETTPIVVDGVMYVGTPLGRVIALDAANGRELWVFDPQIARDVPYGDFANRGVATWRGDAVSDSSVSVKLPCGLRPGPPLGSDLSIRASMRIALMPPVVDPAIPPNAMTTTIAAGARAPQSVTNSVPLLTP